MTQSPHTDVKPPPCLLPYRSHEWQMTDLARWNSDSDSEAHTDYSLNYEPIKNVKFGDLTLRFNNNPRSDFSSQYIKHLQNRETTQPWERMLFVTSVQRFYESRRHGPGHAYGYNVAVTYDLRCPICSGRIPHWFRPPAQPQSGEYVPCHDVLRRLRYHPMFLGVGAFKRASDGEVIEKHDWCWETLGGEQEVEAIYYSPIMELNMLEFDLPMGLNPGHSEDKTFDQRKLAKIKYLRKFDLSTLKATPRASPLMDSLDPLLAENANAENKALDESLSLPHPLRPGTESKNSKMPSSWPVKKERYDIDSPMYRVMLPPMQRVSAEQTYDEVSNSSQKAESPE